MDIAKLSKQDRLNIITLHRFKAMQETEKHLPCPRCGSERMNPKAHLNCLSRRADVYVCNVCGLHEAALEMMGAPIPYEQWWLLRFLESKEANDDKE